MKTKQQYKTIYANKTDGLLKIHLSLVKQGIEKEADPESENMQDLTNWRDAINETIAERAA